jgi:hypothetical protein
MPSSYLKQAARKAARRRFTGTPITGFGPLLPTDSLVERMEAIWGLEPRESTADASTAAGEADKHAAATLARYSK